MRAVATGLFALLLGIATASAQAPVITPAGDPSVLDDSLYALAVDPADHPEEAHVLLLDDGVVRYEIDGTGSQTYRMIGQVLKPEAVETWAEHSFTWNPERERLRLNWARVVRPDGTVISAEPMHRQESDIPAPEGAPVFSARRRLRISLAGVEPGTLVDYSYTTELVDPVLEGDAFSSWFINPGSTIRRSRLILDLPADAGFRVHEIDVGFEPRIDRVDGRVVREWNASDLARIEPEPFTPDSTGLHQHIRYAGRLSWADIGRWYRDLAAGRYEPTPALRERLEALTGDAGSPEDALRRVHRWIAQDLRYVSLSLGLGGYQPRTPDTVLETLSGDCKDKATLFIAMARALGFEAYPVLTTAARVDTTLPSLRQFDHAIARVEGPDGPLYVDLTADLVPFGHLPGSLHGSTGLVVPEEGDPWLVTFPDPPATASRHRVRLTGALDTTGAFRGTYHEEGSGLMQYGLRQTFARTLTAQERQNTAQALASGLFQGGRGGEITAFDGRDLEAVPALSMDVEAPGATSRTPTGDHILPLPIASLGNERLLRYFEETEERRAPFDVGALSGDVEVVRELEIELPAGWTADLPGDASVSSRFGTYESTYEQDGTTLRIRRRFVGGRGIAPPSARSELVEWLAGVVADNHRYLSIHPAP